MRAWLLAFAVLAGCGQTAAAPQDAGSTDDAVADVPALPQDTSVVTDGQGDGHDAKTPPDVQVTQDGLCFVNGPPGPQRTVVEVPKPTGCPPLGPVLPWPTPDGAPPSPPTLDVELGTSEEQTGAFVPYVEGQWAPIVHGVQGGIHVWAAVRTTLPGQKPGKTTLTIAGKSLLECKPVAAELTGTALVHADLSGKWTSASVAVPGTPIAFVDTSPVPYCGQWITLEVEVRHPETLQWGRASVLLRLYDAANL
jgi:hypothetical protein